MWVIAWVRNHVGQLRPNQLFTTRDMLSYGKRRAVDSALSRMVKNGEIVRLAWGVFARADHPDPGSISAREVATEKADAFGKRLMSDQADAAANLGLPARSNDRVVFQVDGRSSKFRLVLKDVAVFLKGTSARKMLLAEQIVGQAIRGLWELKTDGLSQASLQKIWSSFKRSERKEFRAKARWMPYWLSDFIFAGPIRLDRRRINGEKVIAGEGSVDGAKATSKPNASTQDQIAAKAQQDPNSSAREQSYETEIRSVTIIQSTDGSFCPEVKEGGTTYILKNRALATDQLNTRLLNLCGNANQCGNA